MSNPNLISSFIDKLSKEQINYYSFNELKEIEWNNHINKLENSKLFFSSNKIDYDREYYNSKYFLALLFNQNKNLCGFKFYLVHNKIYLYQPFFSKNFEYLLGVKIIKTINSFFNEQQIKVDIINLFNTNQLNEKFKILFCKNRYVLIPGYDMFVDLNYSEEYLWKTIRKSFKSFINNGRKIFSLKKITSYRRFDDCRLLHKKVSGSITRSQRTWDIQYKDLKEDKSVVFYIEDDHENIIGFSIFNIGDTIVNYSVGVYDRDKFNYLQISHFILWESILYFKNTHKYLYLGNYNPELKEKNIKLSNINDFKMGFCNHIVSNSILEVKNI